MATPVRTDIRLADGRRLRVHSTSARSERVIVWHHGSPQTGALLDPLIDAAEERGIRLVSYGRPSYGGSTPQPGRRVSDAGDDVRQILDSLGIERAAMMGASGGGPHALAAASHLPDRVGAVACFAGIAPYTDEFDWFGGMVAPGGLKSALEGRAARAAFAETDEFDDNSFVDTDWAALRSDWLSLGRDAGLADAAGPDGLIDDDVAFVSPWGFDLADIAMPVMLAQGSLDRVVPQSHAEWMARLIPGSELWLRPLDGHIAILGACTEAMDWILAEAE